MANVAASGGYWVSTPADRIFAEPVTITSSIGVVPILPTFDKALAKIGVTAVGIATTPLSGPPALLARVNAAFAQLAQASVPALYGSLPRLVATHRSGTRNKRGGN